jgi:hypothetical protein
VVVVATGIVQVGLGLLLWTGRGYALLPLHMGVGATFVAAIWVLTALAGLTGARPVPVVGAVAWGGLVAAFGMLQTRLLPGAAHWVVETTHLLIGIAAMVIAARLHRFVEKSQGRDRAPLRSGIFGICSGMRILHHAGEEVGSHAAGRRPAGR